VRSFRKIFGDGGNYFSPQFNGAVKVGIAALRRFVLDRCTYINQARFVEHCRQSISNSVVHADFSAPLKEGMIKGPHAVGW